MEVTLTKRGTDYALRIKGATPELSTRISTHFIIVLDNSGSMSEDSKLTNVKKCIQAMLECLNADDRISLITFESISEIHLAYVPVDHVNKLNIHAVLDKIQPESMTNISAALGNIRLILSQSDPNIKTGIILLTDGHVNQGITKTADIKAIANDIQQSYNGVSFHCIGYGNDHNAQLLNEISMETQGSYNIVNSIEDVATSFGDTLGGLMSCVAQNIVAILPADAVVHGPFKNRVQPGGGITIHIGDLYAGTDKIILYSASSSDKAIVQGNTLPLLSNVKYEIVASIETERSIEIELVRHRYTCTSILQEITHWYSLNTTQKEELKNRVQMFKNIMQDSIYNANNIAIQLRAEIPIMESAVLSNIQESIDMTVLSQHISYFGLGRGFNTPSRATENPIGLTQIVDDDEDPTSAVFQNSVQRSISNTIRLLCSTHQ